ncbi:MAG TPA: hypothetical protein VEA15_07800 [Caulobacteraceae bacterium]|nr:hypothetical protein [Caulobacteraceae bacterium]
MATSLHDTGEAWLPADQKRFVRGITYGPSIRGGARRAAPVAIGGLVLAVAVAGLTFAASII